MQKFGHRKDTGAVGQQKRRMFGRLRASARIASTVLAAGAALALAGCSAGQITQTGAQMAAVNGEQASAGQLQISDAKLAFPEGDARHWSTGSDVPLSMSIANNSGKDDVLQSVTTSLSDDVQIKGDKVVTALKALSVGGAPAKTEGEADAATGSGEFGNATIVLGSIKRDVFPGQVVMVTLTFRDAGSVELRMPIAAPEHGRPEQPHEEPGH